MRNVLFRDAYNHVSEDLEGARCKVGPRSG